MRDSIPRGIAEHLEAAKARTGPTEALRIAEGRLPKILAMSPEQFERFARNYMAGKKRNGIRR